MGVQVKIFDEEHEEDLEIKVNKFLKNDIDSKNFIDIKYSVAAFSSPTGDQIYCYSAIVIFKE